jgi:hypothetical protein
VAGVAVLVNISTKLVIAEVKLHMSEANFNKYKIESEAKLNATEANFNKYKMESDARLKLAEAEIKKISSQVKEQNK